MQKESEVLGGTELAERQRGSGGQEVGPGQE